MSSFAAQNKRASIVALAGVMAWGLLLPPAQAVVPAESAAAGLAPANVVYTFNKIRHGGVVRDISPPTNRRMVLKGNWKRVAGAGGAQRKAVAFGAVSLGAIKRSESLMPRRQAFAVAMTIKVRKTVGSDSPNLAQLGYYRQKGQWKIEFLPNRGRVLFRVKGAARAAAVSSRVSIDDGKYHQVTCFRKRGKLGVIIDGEKRVRQVKTGAIRNPRKVSIGNKSIKSSADQFFGNFDYFSMALGRQSIDRANAAAPMTP